MSDEEEAIDVSSEDETSQAFNAVRAQLAELDGEAQRLTTGVREPGTDIVPHRAADPVAVKKQMAAIRAHAKKTSLAIKARQKELERLMKAEMEKAQAMLGPMEELVKQLEANIFTVNLYLGTEEEIVLLRDGASAPADTPITMRQLLLYMDEETAAFAEDGGIKAVDVDVFDEWLMADAAHLDQVLPETKGIVALRPRRSMHRDGRGDDSQEIRKTYWLIRNGERVYRTLTQLEVADNRVLPYGDEFERIFTRHEKGRAIPLTPGSYAWEKAQNAAAATERKYMRVGLLLEGLLHRTPIFHPLPENDISFIDPASVREGKIHYITDAEALLGTGAESFSDWRGRLCGELRVGMRVILGPGLSREGYRQRQGNPRLSPTIANEPKLNHVYTIEERKSGGGLVFRYHEGTRYVGDGAWGGGEYRAPKKRASCTVKPTDEFVLPFDLATVEDMRRFLRSRTDRHNYAAMFPVLKAAIAAKRREAEVEAPFRTMLAGVLARDTNVSVAEAEAAIPELVDWWKLRNKYHRPLLPQATHPEVKIDESAGLTESGRRKRSSAAVEDAAEALAQRERQITEEREAQEQGAKAVRMIVAEYKRRVADTRRGHDPEVITRLHREHPNALLIARLRRGSYLVLDAAEGSKNVYVHESEYSSAGVFKQQREWALPGVARTKQWFIIEQSERWEQWDLVADEREHLRGPESEALVAAVVDELSRSDNGLALAWNGKTFSAWTLEKRAQLDGEHLLSAKQTPATVSKRERGWKRKNGVVALARWGYAHEEHISSSRHELNLPWDKLEHRSFFTDDDSPRQRLHTLVWCNDAAVADVAADQEAYTQISAAAEALNDRVRDLVESIKTEYLARAWAVERARFDEDFGDADLWEAHKKTKERDIRFPHELRPYSGRGSRRHDLLWDAVALFVERGEDVVGRVVADVLKEATTRFGSEQAQAHKSWDSDPAKYVYTAPQELLEYVLAEPIVDEDTESDGADDIEDDE